MNYDEIIIFPNNYRVKTVKLTLGDDLLVCWGSKIRENCRFVKVTPKGFNVLDIDTNRMVFERPVYGKNMANKNYPLTGNFSVEVRVPYYINIKQKEQKKIG